MHFYSPLALCVIFVLVVPNSTAPEPFFRGDYMYLKDLKAFYKEHKERQNWSDALATCSAEGAFLMLPQSQTELDLVKAFIKKDIYWLALHDRFSEGYFITLDGKPDSEIFVNWGNGEPNNVNNNENCAAMGKDGRYLDLDCNRTEYFICVREAGTIVRNEACETYDADYTYSVQSDRCYKFHKTPSTWHDAFKTCKNEQAALANINSEQEAQVFVAMFEKYPSSTLMGNFEKNCIYLGFSDLLKPGFYYTTDGQQLEEVGYNEWSPGQPDNYQGNEHCGCMYRNGKLNDISCTGRGLFICEKTLSNVHVTVTKPPSASLPDE